MSQPAQGAGEAFIDPQKLGYGRHRILGSVERRMDDESIDDLQHRLHDALGHFPELSSRTVTVGCRRNPDDHDYDPWNPMASAESVNFLIRVPTHRRTTNVTLYHELGHLAIHVLDERGEEVPASSEEFCSIFSVARMPADEIDEDRIPYLGEPEQLPGQWPETCRHALQYRADNGPGSHYIKRCKEWLGVSGGGA